VGGHNVLEPAAIGLPVVFGPHMFNFVGARDLLLEAGAAREIRNAAELGPAVAALLGDAAERARMGSAGRAAVVANRGVLQRLLVRVEAMAPC
jgi:3-deoxy-D-manno-octulosonic-acid transferase